MNHIPPSARLNPLAAAVASLLIAVPGAMTPALAADNAQPSSLPDLGGGAKGGTSALAPSAGGVAFSGRLDDKMLSVTPTYSDQTGLSVSAALASRVGESGAVGFMVTGGAEKKEALVNAGFMLDERQRVIFSAGQLRQFLEIGFDSGRDKAEMTQNSGAFSYQLQLGQEFLRFLEVNGYIAETASRDLADKTYAVDTAALFELFNDPRRVAGGRVTGLQGRLIFAPLANSNLKLSFGNERLQYDYLTGRDSTRRFTGGAEWNQQVGAGYSLKLAADSFAAQNRYSFGLERNLSGGQRLGLSLAAIQGRDGAPDDRQIGLTYTYALGGGGGSSGSSGVDFSGRAAGSMQGLLDQVAQRPSFLPAQPVAKLDTTAVSTRLVAVAKAALPAGAAIDPGTGAISVLLGDMLNIAGITLDTGSGAAPFTNAGQFALSGPVGSKNIVIYPVLIAQPAVAAPHTYVLTVNKNGGGTVLVTVVVSHGSVRIDSIVVGVGVPDVIPPTTTAAPSVAGTSDVATTLSARIDEAGTGYYLVLPAAAGAPSVNTVVSTGTGFSMTSNLLASVAVGGLSPSTAYKIWFVAKDAVGNTQAAVAFVAVTTTATADVTPPTTTAAPSVSGTTDVATTLAATINEAGTGYYLVQPFAAAVPSVAAVIAAANSFAMAANVAASVPISGLAASTAYKIYFVAKDAVGNTQAAVGSVAVTTTAAPDITPPVTTAAPSVSGTTDVATTLAATINEAGTGYYLVQPFAAAAPTVNTVTTTGTSFAMAANVAASVPIGGLTASTAYKIYFVAKDTVGNTQASVASIAVTTNAAPDITPPTTTAAPSVSGTTDTGTTLAATINEAGTGYYLVLAAAAPAPTVAAVIAGAHSFAMAANVAASTPITGLTAGTAYNIWFVAKDAVGNTQVSVASVAVTTTSGGANVAPVISAAVTAKIFNLGSAITPVVLPVATDANLGDTLTYTATNLPGGLSLDPVTHTLSGTPTVSGLKTVTYTVTDNWGATDSKTFLINIIDQAPIVVPLAYPANGLGLGHTQVGAGSFSILDYGPLSVTLIADNGGTFNVTAASSGTVSGNGSSSVTITNAVSGAITYDYTSPAVTGAGADHVSITVTDSDAVASSLSFTVTY